MRILGIHDGHNASAALLEDGKVVSALQEERPCGRKNYYGFPAESIRWLLSRHGLQATDIDAVALSSRFISEPVDNSAVVDHFSDQGRFLPLLLRRVSSNPLVQRIRERRSLSGRLGRLAALGFPREKVRIVEHHRCHAAAAYHGLRSKESPYLVLTLDGGGDWLCATVNVAQAGRIERISSTPYGHSIGDLYARTTYMLGFMPWEHEYKLMGMAPYASRSHAREIADVFGRYLALDPGDPLRFRRLTPEPTNHVLPRLRRDLLRRRFDAIAGGVQLFTEELLARWVSACVERTGIRDVLCGGGVFMNVKANKVLSELPGVDSLEVFPSCGDETNSLGAAWDLYSTLDGSPRGIDDFYLGPDFSDAEVESALSEAGSRVAAKKAADIDATVAGLLAEGKIVARCSGRMEFGARALGNRSILADPSHLKVVQVINKMIKSRDFWMPFAPILLRSESEAYVINKKGLRSPYMMQAFDSSGRRDEAAAAVHPADASMRAQLLEQGQNPGCERLLREFKRLTGRSILLNTSFNIHGDPIVYGPREALRTFLASGLEYLAVNSYLIRKSDRTADVRTSPQAAPR